MNKKIEMIAISILIAGSIVWAQSPLDGPETDGMGEGWGQGRGAGRGEGRGSKDGAGSWKGALLMEYFFPPRLIMKNQKVLELTEDQRTEIKTTMRKAMTHYTDLQWKLSAETEVMTSLLKQEQPDEGKVLAQLDKLMKMENSIKRMRLTAMIKVKNILTTEQQAKLKELRKSMRRHGGKGRRGGRGRDGGQGRDGGRGGNDFQDRGRSGPPRGTQQEWGMARPEPVEG